VTGVDVRPDRAPPTQRRPERTARLGALPSPGAKDTAPTGWAAVRDRFSGGDGWATVALAALTLASTYPLSRVFVDNRWVGPVLSTALGVHAASWFARRRRWGMAAGTAASVVVGLLVASWTALGASTTYGVPTGRTASAAGTALSAAQRAVASVVVPVQPTTGFVLAAALTAGLAALVSDSLAFRRRSAVLGAAPAFAMFVSLCALGYGSGRQWVVTAEAVALLVFALVHRASVGIATSWLGGTRAGAVGWAMPAGALVGAAAILAVLVAAPAARGSDGAGVLGWRAGGLGGGGPREVANPIVDLHTRLVNFTDVGVFTVQSTVPSYWRLTSLDTFTGQAWVATNSYKSFAGRLPGAASEPAHTRTVTDHFHIQNLESVWLPAAFTPLSVRGVKGVEYDPASSSLITSQRTSDGLDYSVTSYQYLSTLDPAQLRAAPPLKTDPSTSHYLALPASVPPSVYALARSITASKHTEYDKAVALEAFFLGPSFNYSLDPPTDGFGIDALTTFLFQTRVGYCQQFAGAYAVLARASGLPTRLAVGFAPGTDIGGGNFQVLDADAHTWPEVYFGPKYGWLPFEPTKGFSDPNTVTYAGGVTGTGSALPGASDVLPIAPKTAATTVPPHNQQTATSPTTAKAGKAAAGAPGSGSGGWTAALVVLLMIGAWIVLNSVVRRARWAWRRWRCREDPGAVVLSYWRDTGEVLSWWGIRRLPADTDAEYAGRAAGTLRSALAEPSPWEANGVRRLAVLASEALYAPRLDRNAPAEAAMVAAELRQRLFRRASARRLLLWALTQKPGAE
jgi:transglutaminase-like putative cysteine protease